MDKIWTVDFDDYDEHWSLGAFSDEDAAGRLCDERNKSYERYMKLLMGEEWPVTGHYHVEEWVINEAVEPDPYVKYADDLVERGHKPGGNSLVSER